MQAQLQHAAQLILEIRIEPYVCTIDVKLTVFMNYTVHVPMHQGRVELLHLLCRLPAMS